MNDYLYYKNFLIYAYPSHERESGKFTGNTIVVERSERGKDISFKVDFPRDSLRFKTKEEAISNCFLHGRRYINHYLN